jgi:hypothetical protein|tara:strand:+ start:7412 stop:7651 length:240 start_codon:yes stop_codon:yes gene_type:complete
MYRIYTGGNMIVDDDMSLKNYSIPDDFTVVPHRDPVSRITLVIKRMQEHIEYLENAVREEQAAKYKAFQRIAELTSERG